MNNLSKYGLTKVKQTPKKKSFIKGFFSEPVLLAEIPIFLTWGIIVIAHVAYGMHLWSDAGDPEKNGLKYVPIRSEYRSFVKGLGVLRNKLNGSQPKEEPK